MARAETVTLLPLDRYAEIMQIPLTHFNQLEGEKSPQSRGCDDIWDQDARERLAEAIAQAEEMIADQLGFWPTLKYIVDEPQPFGLLGVRPDWRNAEIGTDWGLVECYGIETLTLKQADAGVEYTDLDNDPLSREETARIGTSIYADLPACSNVCDVAVFFRESDIPEGKGDAADPRWEIRPIRVDIDGETMRITAESSLFVRPHLWELTEQDCFGSDDPTQWKWNFELANLVPAVDVYCRSTNLQTPVTINWDGVCDCPGICQHRTQTACAYSTDKRSGSFVPRPATWNGTTNINAVPLHTVAPESITVSYRSGYPIDSRTCRMNTRLELAIVKLANVILPEPPCGFCDAAEIRWKDDRMRIEPLTIEAAQMPWGQQTKGALDAWRIVKMMAMGRGAKMGR